AGQLAAVAAYRGPQLRVWAKLDSGMHRLGFAPAEAADVAAALAANPDVACVGWMTHLACADDTTSAMTPRQIATFQQATPGLPGLRSVDNSAGIIACHDATSVVWPPAILV